MLKTTTLSPEDISISRIGCVLGLEFRSIEVV